MVDSKPAKKVISWLISQGYISTQKELGERIGITNRSYLSQLVASPTREFIDRLCSYSDKINRDYLLTGKGEMLIDVAEDSDRSNTQLAEPRRENKVDEVMMSTVPLVPVGAFGGKVSGFYEEGVALEDCERVPCPVHGCDIAIDVSGESMAPDFPNGCRVFCRKIHEEAFIAWGNTFVLDTVNGPFIKNIFDAGDGRIEARSINPDFPPFYIPKNSVFGIYRVMFVGKSFAAM